MTRREYYTWEVIDEIAKQLTPFIADPVIRDDLALDIWTKVTEMVGVNSD